MQYFKYLLRAEREGLFCRALQRFYDEVKTIFHHFWVTIIEANKNIRLGGSDFNREQYHSSRISFNTTITLYFTTFELQANTFYTLTIRYSFLFTRKFREFLFSKRLLMCQEKTTPWSNYFLGDYDWGVGISM